MAIMPVITIKCSYSSCICKAIIINEEEREILKRKQKCDK